MVCYVHLGLLRRRPVRHRDEVTTTGSVKGITLRLELVTFRYEKFERVRDGLFRGKTTFPGVLGLTLPASIKSIFYCTIEII